MNELAPRPSQKDFPPHGLVSLWNMLNVNASAFIQAVQTMDKVRFIVEGFDEETKQTRFKDAPLDSQKPYINLIERFGDRAKSLGASTAAVAANELLRELSRGEILFGNLSFKSDDLGTCFRREQGRKNCTK